MELILGRHYIALLAEYIPYILHRLNNLFPVDLTFFWRAFTRRTVQLQQLMQLGSPGRPGRSAFYFFAESKR
jgi:hypothetical protein